MPKYIDMDSALQAHPEFLNEQIDDHDKAIYAKGWNACNSAYYGAIKELENQTVDLNKMVPHWISVEERLPEFHMNDSGCVCTRNIVFRTEYKTVHLGYVIRTAHNIETVDGFEQILMDRWYDQTGDTIEGVTHWMPLPAPPKEDAK